MFYKEEPKINKKICFIAQFPPPIHGLSKAVDTLYNSKLNEKYEFSKVDITNNKSFLKNISVLIKSNKDLYYLTISQSKGGNLRDLIIIKLLLAKNKKILIHLHGGYYRTLLDKDLSNFQRKLNYKLFNKLSGAIVLGDSLKSIFSGVIDDKKIHTVYNCVDDKFIIDETSFNNKLTEVMKKEQFKILYLSNFIESKGYKDILNISKIIKEKHINKFKFIFAGKFFNSEDEKKFFDFIKDNKLENLVEYKGIVLGENKLKLLYESDVFMLLTRYPMEGQPISIIEAMANGMTIITTNHAGIPDLITNNKNGYMVKYDDYESIIDKLMELYEKREQHIHILKNNRLDVEKRFREENYINNMDITFEKILLS